MAASRCARALAATLCALLCDAAAALSCRLPPAARHLVLAELFSSEGCDSCPPAERLFAALQPDAQLVPVVWHVDYFDALGWVDRYALPAAGHRQQALVLAQHEKAVVTPQVFIDGSAFADWRDLRAFRSRVARRAAAAAAPALALQRVERVDGGVAFEVTLAGAAPTALSLHAALLESGLVSQVTQGENRGLRLQHSHVVRAATGPRAYAAPGPWRGQLPLPSPTPTEFTLVAWAQDDSATTLNATWAVCTS